MTVVWVAVGGALGALGRYGLGGWVQRASGFAFPWGTMAVNLLGSLLIGFLMVWLRASGASTNLRVFLIAGVLGGFTTFSAFGWETVSLLQQGTWGRAALYALGSLVLGVLAVLLGIALADALLAD
jgi:CrcB protein